MTLFPLNRSFVLQLLILLALSLPLIGAGYVVWSKHQRVIGILADLDPRYARLQGLINHTADLKSLAEKTNAQLVRRAYPAGQDVTQAGNDAQQRIRNVFTENHLDIISIQVLPAKETGSFDRIAVNLRVEGNLANIHAALEKLMEQTPVVSLDSMSLQTVGAVRPASIQRLSGQFDFSAFRVHP